MRIVSHVNGLHPGGATLHSGRKQAFVFCFYIVICKFEL